MMTKHYEEFEDTKGVIRICISKKNRQHNGQKVQKDKQRSTNYTHKTKDRVTLTPLKISGEFRCFGRVSSSCSISGSGRVNLVTLFHLQWYIPQVQRTEHVSGPLKKKNN